MPESGRGTALGDELARIHDQLRRQLGTLLADVDDHLARGISTADLSPAGLSDQLRERCLSACDVLHAHHANENERGFLRLEQRFPDLAPVLDRLRREHEKLAGIRQRVQEALAGLGDGDADGIQAELRHLATEMDAHFDREERHLAAALNSL
jgi:hypothetical protein